MKKLLSLLFLLPFLANAQLTPQQVKDGIDTNVTNQTAQGSITPAVLGNTLKNSVDYTTQEIQAVQTVLQDKITLDDVYPLLGNSERTEVPTTSLTNISDYVNPAMKGSGTAYFNGKNFYNTVWSSGNGASLITQGTNTVSSNVTAGTQRSSGLAARLMPIGTFTVTAEMTVLSGTVNQTQNMYINRPGHSPVGTAVNMQLVNGKYVATLTFTNTVETNMFVYIQHSGGTAGVAFTASITTQIEAGSTATAIEPFNGGTVTLSSAEYSIPEGAIYAYPASTASLTLLRTQFSSGGGGDSEVYNTVISAWGDSMTFGTGSSQAKPSSDTNTDVSYPAQLSRLIPTYTVKNLGVGGETSWMIAARQGGAAVRVEPFTLPATTTQVRVYLNGLEEDFYYNGTNWTYDKDNLKYNIAVVDGVGVNPVVIDGVEGTLTRTQLSAGTPDPTTGETVQSATFAYYFQRSVAGASKTTLVPKDIVTIGAREYSNDIQIIWMGQNDAPTKNSANVLQKGSFLRAKLMVEYCKMKNKRYIVMNAASGSNAGNAVIDQEYAQEFGSHYINIRKFICDYGVGIAAAGGMTVKDANNNDVIITNDAINKYWNNTEVDATYATVGASNTAGVISRAFRATNDGVHGNYWYYYVVAKAVYEKGRDLQYWQ